MISKEVRLFISFEVIVRIGSTSRVSKSKIQWVNEKQDTRIQ